MDPSQLVQQFKKSGEFDRLRRHLLSQFQRSDGITTFKAKVEDIARQRLASDDKLQQLPSDVVHKELMQEVDRQALYPIVERAAADICTLSDASLADDVRSSVQRMLQGSMPESNLNTCTETPMSLKEEVDATPKHNVAPEAQL